MTRYARCGSTQKHKKLPGDATPWEEFSRNAKGNSESNAGPSGNKKIRKGRIEKKKHQLKQGFPSKKLAKWSGLNDSEVQVFRKHLAEEKYLKNTKQVKTNIYNDSNDRKNSISVLSEPNLSRNVDSEKISLESILERNNELNIPLLTESNESNDIPAEKELFERLSKKFRKQNKDLQMKVKQFYDQNEEERIVSDPDSSLFTMGDKTLDAPQSKRFSKTQLKKSERKEKLHDMKTETELPKKDVPRNGNFLKMSLGNMQGNNGLNISLQTQSNEFCDVPVENELSKRQSKKLKKQNKSQDFKIQDGKSFDDKKKKEIINNDPISSFLSKDSEIMPASQANQLSKSQLKKAKRKQKFQRMKMENALSERVQESNNSEEKKEIDGESAKDKDFKGKKKLYFEKLQKRRLENGIVLLPSKVERKIYNIKRSLRKKGVTPEFIKTVIRKERRKEENKFRKTFSTKPCFNCRETGHLLAECPLHMSATNQETGICFKCGSAEHVSYKCPKKVEGYPLAKCFVCKELGHISKDCPKNERGIYIQEKKHAIPANAIKGGTVGAETIGNATKTKKKMPQQYKIVKF